MFFDEFIDSQNVSYYLLKNSLLNGKLSHAYLIDSNNSENVYDFVFAFIKMILCKYHYSCYSSDKCKDCNLCYRVDHHNYSDIKIIESDSSVIKKEQLIELQSDFSKYSVEGKWNIYIIKDCDKMNKQASNSLLKFLEEPNDGVIAFLVTNHFNKILSTIVSRCQIIRLNNNVLFHNRSSLDNFANVFCHSSESFEQFINDERNLQILNTVSDFISYFEDNGLDVLLFMKKMWYNKVQTRDDNLLAFQFLIYFYYDFLKCKIGDSNYLFCDHYDLIVKISNLNTMDSLLEKISILQYGYDMILSNLNVNLLLDDIIVRLGEVK